jgi:hypothetical protein
MRLSLITPVVAGSLIAVMMFVPERFPPAPPLALGAVSLALADSMTEPSSN